MGSNWLNEILQKIDSDIRQKTKPRSIKRVDHSDILDIIAKRIDLVYQRCPGKNYFYVFDGDPKLSIAENNELKFTHPQLQGQKEYLIEDLFRNKKFSPVQGVDISFNDVEGSFTILDSQFSIEFNYPLVVWLCGIENEYTPPINMGQYQYAYLDYDPEGVYDNIIFGNKILYDKSLKFLNVPLTSDADQKWLVFKFPLSQTPFQKYFNTDFNSGDIPDILFRNMESYNGSQFLSTRKVINIDPDNLNIIFSHD